MFAEGVYSIQNLVLLVLTVVAFGVEVWALIDALTQKSGAFVAASKLTKPIWIIILAVATALPLGNGGVMQPLGLLSIVAVVAAAVYLTDVRPAVRQLRGRGGGGGRSGPYGPW
jgi:hypothetical protein